MARTDPPNDESEKVKRKGNQIMKNRNTTFTTILLALGFLALSPITHAVVPAPDGGYPGGNTAEGQDALLSRTNGLYNTAVGIFSVLSLTDGNFCTGLGAGTLLANTADGNTATGAGALLTNTTGEFNTANGEFALFSNTTGGFNTAIGSEALLSNTTGGSNIAVGRDALFNNTEGGSNMAMGVAALFINTAGDRNTAIGQNALFGSTGGGNVAVGYGAGSAVTTASDVICIGTDVVGEDVGSHTYIGNINTTSVSGGNADFVTVDLTTGLLGHLSSSRRYKEEIKPMDKASEVLFALKPVTYRYKKDIDRTQALDYGLVAEEVAKIDPNLAIRDANGQIETVRYNAINAMLLNEFLKEHKKVEEQGCKIEVQEAATAQQRNDCEATIAQLKREVETLVARSREQDAKIQKVSAQDEFSRSSTKVAGASQ
jgi:hypothetical protein